MKVNTVPVIEYSKTTIKYFQMVGIKADKLLFLKKINNNF